EPARALRRLADVDAGGERELVARDSAERPPAADELLRRAEGGRGKDRLAGEAGRLEEGAAGGVVGVEDRVGRGLVGFPAEVEGAEAELGEFEAGAAHESFGNHEVFGFGARRARVVVEGK